MPTFASVFDRAVEIARVIEDYETMRLIVADEPRRQTIMAKMTDGHLRAYDEIMRTAYFQLLAVELKAQQIAHGR